MCRALTSPACRPSFSAPQPGSMSESEHRVGTGAAASCVRLRPLPQRPAGGASAGHSCLALLSLPCSSLVSSSCAPCSLIPERPPRIRPRHSPRRLLVPLGAAPPCYWHPLLSPAASPVSALPRSPWTLSLPHRRPGASVAAPTRSASEPLHGPCPLVASLGLLFPARS